MRTTLSTFQKTVYVIVFGLNHNPLSSDQLVIIRKSDFIGLKEPGKGYLGLHL